VLAYRDRMDCLRSVLDGPAGAVVPVVLVGRGGGAAAGPPKKSSPSSDSEGLDCFGAAGSALAGG